MRTEPRAIGDETYGRFVAVNSICFENGTHQVAMRSGLGVCHFAIHMTPTEARELAGYLNAEANYAEQASKPVDWSAA